MESHIKDKLNHKIPAVFHNLKNYDSYLIMQEQSKFNFKINVAPITFFYARTRQIPF